jgi:FkbM family methyltransferase
MIAKFFLRYLPQFVYLRNVPILGDLLHWLSYRLLHPTKRIWIQVRKGIGKGLWLKLNPRTGMVLYNGSVELPVQETLRAYLHPGMVFYDIGANIGFYTLIAARIVGQEGSVYAFEPEPDCVQRLKGHVERNGFSNVLIAQVVVWSMTGSVNFIRSDPSCSPDRGLGRIASDKLEDAVAVPSIALDDFIQQALPPHFIKCDVENAEVKVFQGAQKLIAKYKPIVVCEVHSENNSVLLQQLFGDFGYSLSWLTNNHLLALPYNYNEEKV